MTNGPGLGWLPIARIFGLGAYRALTAPSHRFVKTLKKRTDVSCASINAIYVFEPA